MEKTTPMLRQYLEIKKKFPGTILFFRLGDFYEMFNEDAVIGSRELEIVLTARQKDSANPMPMCGFPHHAAANYIARLVKKGYRVAICEQTEPAGKGVKLVNREVVKVITPGTAIDSQLLESREPVFLAAVCSNGDVFGGAFLDLSTGDFFATQRNGTNALRQLMDDVENFRPREILYPESSFPVFSTSFFGRESRPVSLIQSDNTEPTTVSMLNAAVTTLEDNSFDIRDAADILKRELKVSELSGFGLVGKNEAIRAARACLQYAKETQNSPAGHITAIKLIDSAEFMVLDALTLRNLELIESNSGNPKASLLNIIDETVTGMGGRLLRSWLLRPSVKRSEIQTRYVAVEEFSGSILREKIRFLLKEVGDIERLVGRLNLGTATPRDLVNLKVSLEKTPVINATLADATSLLLQVLSENIFELPDIRDLLSKAINEDPPVNFSDGGVIRENFNAELDELRAISSDAKQTIAAFETKERERTGISNLKIRFNNVFGYFIEISKGNTSRAPEDYERRQTLTNAERYTTKALKEWEAKVLGAEEKIGKLELELFDQVRKKVCDATPKLISTARALATLDSLAALAETAARRNFVLPVLHDGDEISIKNGRHPMIEAYSKDSFIPNDAYLNNSTDRLLIVTGANMGGKSTILRQIAIIQILAQMGSYVPATSARLPIVDRIWTRVGASDDLTSGRSTFMVEMTETASILHSATPRSLILLDEIGRGTSTFDGLSIAWAVAEYLHNSPEHSAKTIFATHYHELTELAENLPGAKNYQITATEENGEVVFLHKLQQGKASKSYGIAVAKLAGLPQAVIERAKSVLSKLEEYELAVFADERSSSVAAAVGKKLATQHSLFAISNETIIERLRQADVQNMDSESIRRLLTQVQRDII